MLHISKIMIEKLLLKVIIVISNKHGTERSLKSNTRCERSIGFIGEIQPEDRFNTEKDNTFFCHLNI